MRVLIADDEALARRRLRRLLEAMPEVTVVGECLDGLQVLQAVRDTPVDVVLLDIHMPHLSGVEALKLLDGPDAPAVILCTAHGEHALDAFEGGAVDYVLKPIEAARLRKALDRVQVRPRVPTERAELPEQHGRMPVATARGIVMVQLDTITHARIDGASVVIHTHDQRLFTDLTLAQLERQLPGSGFLRVHRKALIALRHLERLEPLDSGGYLAHLAGGPTVEVSRAAARALRKRWSIS